MSAFEDASVSGQGFKMQSALVVTYTSPSLFSTVIFGILVASRSSNECKACFILAPMASMCSYMTSRSICWGVMVVGGWSGVYVSCVYCVAMV